MFTAWRPCAAQTCLACVRPASDLLLAGTSAMPTPSGGGDGREVTGEGPPPRALTTRSSCKTGMTVVPSPFVVERTTATGVTAMQTDVGRTFAMPSALVLSELLAGHAGDPPLEALEQAGFDRNEQNGYLRRRAAR